MPRISLETLSEELLKKSVSSDLMSKGHELYLAGKASVTQLSQQVAKCAVQDRHPYKVEIQVGDKFIYLKCDCLYANRGAICEHDVAAFLAVRNQLIQNQPARWREQLGGVVSATQAGARRTKSNPYFLFFSLQEIPAISSWSLNVYTLPVNALPAEIRQDPQLIDHPEFEGVLEAIGKHELPLRSPYNALNPQACVNCTPESVFFANVMLERARSYSYYNTTAPQPEYLTILARTQSPLFLGDPYQPLQKRLAILENQGSLRLRLDRDVQGLHLTSRIAVEDLNIPLQESDPDNPIRVVWLSPLWLIVEHYLFQVDGSISPDLLYSLIETPTITIPPKDELEFRNRHLLDLAEKIALEGDVISWEDQGGNPVPRIYLAEEEGEISAELRFGYGEYELRYDPRLPEQVLQRKPDSWTLVRLQRQPEIEAERFTTASSSSYGLKRGAANRTPGKLYLRARQHPIDFLLHKVPHLAKDGFEIYGEEKLKTARVNRNTPRISFNISSGIDWFDVQAVVSFGELEVPLKELRRAVRKNERYIKLADGTIGEIPAEWVERYKHLFALGDETQDGLRLNRYQLSYLDQLIAQVDQVQTDDGFDVARRQLRRLTENGFAGINPRTLPWEFTGELRPYQKAGFDWLHFLRDFKFGGCLADDMGLGKTVQALVFLQSIYRKAPDYTPPSQASLLIVPRSLLVNWQRESARFTPGLRVLEYFDSDRIKDLEAFSQADLVITSYGVMLRDIILLRKYRFHYVILDESQSIKNPVSQTAKAARLLEGDHRLVMTGTPIENSTVELWSQFAFLNPGLLGSLDYFRDEFGTPIESKKDEDTARLLRKLVYPFILRRTKDQVAPELPPRTERILYADMQPAQQKIYHRMRDYYRGMLLGMLDEDKLSQNRMKILEGLLRLRQISNHPLLVDDKYRGESGKFELLLETLETLLAEGHKALVFSQFVQMLRLVRHALDDRKIPYAYLDGHTLDRQGQVDLFQNDPKLPFFLISLKAGGKGLNLTAADYVIHIDPWWNPAVEMQASDRTHRIGQDKPVFVFKLITRDTVEEKIVLLQQRKQELVDQIIVTDSSFFKSLTSEDLVDLFGK